MTVLGLRGSARETSERPPRAVFTGTGTLVGAILRRDRVRLLAWLLGTTLLLAYFATVLLPGIAGTDDELADLRRIMDGSVGALFGPGYGRDAISQELYIAGVYGLFFFILAALMTILLVARNTRADEQSGRAELVWSGAVARHAPLTAALIVAVGTNLLLAVLIGSTMTLSGFDAGDGMLFGASVGAVGLAFAGITALGVQVSESTRVATGIAGATLGAAWAVRAIGDMIRDHGSALSWMSPLAWSNQTRPYVDGRWWPLLLSVGLAAACTAGGYALSARRDVGAGLVAARPGKPEAPRWLTSPVAVAFRLQRASLIWWTTVVAASSFVFGGLADQIADPEDMSADRLEMFGGSLETLIDGYLGFITLIVAAMAGIMVVLGVQAIRTEETKGRAEPVLATATSRLSWLGSQVAVLSLGLVALLVAGGTSSGVGAALSSGDASYLWTMPVAHLAHGPAVLVTLGLAVLLFGRFPRVIPGTWAVVGAGLVVGVVGSITELPRWIGHLVPSEHVGRPPLDDISSPATMTLLVIATVLAAAGSAAFARRDLDVR
jgi:ABC-2 type transport system permease protein